MSPGEVAYGLVIVTRWPVTVRFPQYASEEVALSITTSATLPQLGVTTVACDGNTIVIVEEPSARAWAVRKLTE
jgi:hypothetical protein